MPGLTLFGRRWSIATDDFVVPCIEELVIRFMWLGALVAVYVLHQHDFDCDNGHTLEQFYIGSIAIDAAGLVNSWVTLYISLQGTISDSWPRRNIFWCLYIRVLQMLVEAVWIGLSTYWLFGHSSISCDSTVVWTAKGAVLFSWFTVFLVLVRFLVIFDPLGTRKRRAAVQCNVSRDGTKAELLGTSTSAHRLWEKRCQTLCCCMACGDHIQDAFSEVGAIVSDFFADLDLVPRDIAAGLILVQQQQQQQEADSGPFEVRVVTSGSTAQPPPARLQSGASNEDAGATSSSGGLPEPKLWMNIPNLAYYMRYAVGNYGWPVYMCTNPCTGIWDLCSRCRCCAGGHGVSVYDDNMCHCNTAAIRRWLVGVDKNLVYVSFHDEFKQSPFLVAADHTKNVVVISIRGSFTPQDGLSYLDAMGDTIAVPGVDNAYCHGAVLSCAHYIREELETMELLQTAFSKLRDGAGLVIAGHSLGAGVATMLAILLRPRYPQLMCYAFSPPGGLLSPSLSRYTQEFICSTAVGEDLVLRMDLQTLTSLKVETLRALLNSNLHKHQILSTGCMRLLCCCCSSNADDSEQTQTLVGSGSPARSERSYTEESPRPAEDGPSTSTASQTPRRRNHRMQESLRDCEARLEEIVRTRYPLYPPGQFLHIVETDPDSTTCLTGEAKYQAYWTDASLFDKIVLSGKMLSDHMPNVVMAALDQLVKRDAQPIQPAQRTTC